MVLGYGLRQITALTTVDLRYDSDFESNFCQHDLVALKYFFLWWNRKNEFGVQEWSIIIEGLNRDGMINLNDLADFGSLMKGNLKELALGKQQLTSREMIDPVALVLNCSLTTLMNLDLRCSARFPYYLCFCFPKLNAAKTKSFFSSKAKLSLAFEVLFRSNNSLRDHGTSKISNSLQHLTKLHSLNLRFEFFCIL